MAQQANIPESLLKDAEKILKNKWTYPCMKSFPPKEKTITTLFQVLFPYNTDPSEVYVKASVLNQFYSTNILAISKLSTKIVKLGIDADLQVGKVDVVNKIANISSVYHFYSFASKYCAMHKPCSYPINDKIVRGFLAKVIAKGNLAKYNNHKRQKIQMEIAMLRDYSFYKEVYDAFMQQYGLSSLGYQNVDAYIWITCKEKPNDSDLLKLTK